MSNVADPSSPDPRASRESLFLGAEIRHGGVVLQGRVRNVSSTGAWVDCTHRLRVGDSLRISFQGVQDAEAQVARVTERGVGLHFDAPIDPSTCRRNVAPKQTDWTKDYVLCLREGAREPIWQNDALVKRPKLR
ncbi:PilZ domain-containing protein [Sphingomonas abietis]|uniref:PilZ domain-containing protein n=1 Tax=Sphingomonas abietis TaxID=3012344 RepID=A0ABY7NRG4_9SPHN|nr:PilZ domain-containing protein [Sphingomonas abietis]WBO23777.1 PilZ domain-containing protein [Sphingomonas abietis]